MPELPDLVHVEAILRSTLTGRRVADARMGDPVALRLMTNVPFGQALVGRRLVDVRRRGQFLRFALDDDWLVIINAMLVGKYDLGPRPARDPVALIFALGFAPESETPAVELRYLDDKRMGKVYVLKQTEETMVPGYGELGADVLTVSRAAFAALAHGRRDQVRNFLLDKRALASIGNAYADEILFAAKLHPKTFCHQLKDDQVDALHAAMGQVLRDAIAEIERRNPAVSVKLRDFLRVRGRAGKPCQVCGTTLREVRVGPADACFCPTCQPPGRALFIDWSKVSHQAKTTGTGPGGGKRS